MEMASNKLEEFLNKYPEVKAEVYTQAVALGKNNIKEGHPESPYKQAETPKQLNEMVAPAGKKLIQNGAELANASSEPNALHRVGSKSDSSYPKFGYEADPANQKDNAFSRAQNAQATEKTPQNSQDKKLNLSVGNKQENAFTRAQNAPTAEKTPSPTKAIDNER